MRLIWVSSRAVAAIACLLTLGTSLAHAQTLRWPAASYLPKPAPAPASPPAVLERPATSVAGKAAAQEATATVCHAGRVCVICVAACDLATPVVVQSLKPRATDKPAADNTTENDSDGVADTAPRFARQQWAGIECGTESGCRVSGVSAPPRTSSLDVRVTVIRPRVGGGNSWYIDGP